VTSDPYSLPSDPAKRRSAALTDGPDRAPARAMLKAIGLTRPCATSEPSSAVAICPDTYTTSSTRTKESKGRAVTGQRVARKSRIRSSARARFSREFA
jgi:hypothetical protein